MSEQIKRLEKDLKSLQKMYDDRTYLGKYSDLLCEITMKEIKLDKLKKGE